MRHRGSWNTSRFFLLWLVLALLLTLHPLPHGALAQREPEDGGNRVDQLAAMSGLPVER